MPINRKMALSLVFATTLALPSVAMADDRPPTAEERAAIEEALRTQGFTSWEEIELDDGVWEIDDAVHADGKKYDVKLNPDDLAMVEQEED